MQFNQADRDAYYRYKEFLTREIFEAFIEDVDIKNIDIEHLYSEFCYEVDYQEDCNIGYEKDAFDKVLSVLVR